MSESIEELKARIFGYVDKNLMNRANAELMLALIEELKEIKGTMLHMDRDKSWDIPK